MGPKIFNLYTPEISWIVKRHGLKCHMFADDVIIYSAITANLRELDSIRNCLNEINIWSQNNYLKLNNDKTKFVQIKTRHSKVTLDKLLMLDKEFTCD